MVLGMPSSLWREETVRLRSRGTIVTMRYLEIQMRSMSVTRRIMEGLPHISADLLTER
jgi:hypothetical protein